MLKQLFGLRMGNARTLPATIVLVVLCFCCLNQTVQAQTSAFNYQGKLAEAGAPANGFYQFQFKVFGAATGGDELADAQTVVVNVQNGMFTTRLDFGAGVYSLGFDLWLQIGVRPNDCPDDYTVLTPRQRLNSAPFAVQARNAKSADNAKAADSLSAGCNECITDAQVASVDGSKITGTVSSATNATTATNVSGIVAITNGGTGSSTKNFIDTTSNQTGIGGDKEFTGTVRVSGPNGHFAGDGAGLTNVSAAAIADGSVTTSKITDGSITAAKLGPDAVVQNVSNATLLGALRWDLLKGQSSFTVGGSPNGVVFDGANIWVTNSNSDGVTRLRASDGLNLGTFPIGGASRGVAFDGANIWVTNSNSVTKLRASDGANLGSFSGGTAGVAFDGTNIWIATSGVLGFGGVTKLRASDGANQGSFFTEGTSDAVGVAFDGANVWVTNRGSNNVTKLRASDGANLGTFSVGSSPVGIAFDDANIWVTNNGSNSVTKLRASDGVNLGTFVVGNSPNGIAFDGANIWVANIGNANNPPNVTKLRASDGANLGSVPAAGPVGVAFDGVNIWVTNFTGTVTKLPRLP